MRGGTSADVQEHAKGSIASQSVPVNNFEQESLAFRRTPVKVGHEVIVS
jgi:hypothetical protein